MSAYRSMLAESKVTLNEGAETIEYDKVVKATLADNGLAMADLDPKQKEVIEKTKKYAKRTDCLPEGSWKEFLKMYVLDQNMFDPDKSVEKYKKDLKTLKSEIDQDLINTAVKEMSDEETDEELEELEDELDAELDDLESDLEDLSGEEESEEEDSEEDSEEEMEESVHSKAPSLKLGRPVKMTKVEEAGEEYSLDPNDLRKAIQAMDSKDFDLLKDAYFNSTYSDAVIEQLQKYNHDKAVKAELELWREIDNLIGKSQLGSYL